MDENFKKRKLIGFYSEHTVFRYLTPSDTYELLLLHVGAFMRVMQIVNDIRAEVSSNVLRDGVAKF